MTEAVKRVYAFGKDANGNNVTEGNTEMKWVLGGMKEEPREIARRLVAALPEQLAELFARLSFL